MFHLIDYLWYNIKMLNKIIKEILILSLVVSVLIVINANASLYFVTEENEVNTNNFIINADDSSSDYVDLEFGSILDVKLRYDILNSKFIFDHDVQITQIIDTDGNIGTNGQALISDGTGKNIWQNITASTIPYITTTVPRGMGSSTTKDLSYEGINILPNSVISIPTFTGTINSTNIISPTEFEINVTSDATTGTYDILVSNNGILNTEWPNNGENLLIVSDNNGASQSSAGESCNGIIDDYPASTDGTYWINPDGGDTSNAFQVYCDMSTDGGGWTKIEYASDLAHQAHFSDGDTSRWLDNDFSLTLSDTQINDIRSVSTEGKQTYQGTCDGVIHYEYSGGFAYAFGFRYHDGHETAYEQETYPSTNITIAADGCYSNSDSSTDTVFEIQDVRLPIVNVHTRDNSSSEEFGSPLTSNPAWLR